MKILIVAPAWVGDMVMSHCLVQVLLSRYSTASGTSMGAQDSVVIDMLAPRATHPLAQRMPGVSHAHLMEIGHGELALAARRALGLRLAATGYDQAIVLSNSFKSALVPAWAGIPRRTGWTGEARIGILNDRRKLVKSHYPLMIERFMALGLDPGIMLDKPYPRPKLQTDPTNADVLRDRHGLHGDAVTVLCPGAEYGPAKQWPAKHYAGLARHEVTQGREVWLIGSPNDAIVCAEIRNLAPSCVHDLSGKTSLLDALDLIGLAGRVVTNDSGLMHLACALDRSVVAVFGSTSPDFTPPLSDRAKVVRKALPCSPCFERECPLGHLNCLNEITPGQVIEVM